MKYRKLPEVIDAIIFDGINYLECTDFIEGKFDNTKNYPNIKTLEGVMRIDVGDYIIKGVKGEFYPCKPDIFEMTYEKVVESWGGVKARKYLEKYDNGVECPECDYYWMQDVCEADPEEDDPMPDHYPCGSCYKLFKADTLERQEMPDDY